MLEIISFLKVLIISHGFHKRISKKLLFYFAIAAAGLLILALILPASGSIKRKNTNDFNLSALGLNNEKFSQNGFEFHSMWSSDQQSQSYRFCFSHNQLPETEMSITERKLKIPQSIGGYRFNLFEGSKGGFVISFYTKDMPVNSSKFGIRNITNSIIQKEISDQLPSKDWPIRVLK